MSVNPGIPDNMDTFLTPRDIARAIIKRGDFILIITVIATCCGIVTAFMHPPVYDARSELLLKRSSLGTEGEPLDSSPGFPTIATNIRQIYQEGELRTEIVMIKSRDLIIDVMDELQLTREQFDNINDYRKYVRKTITGTKNAFFSIISEFKYFFRLGKRPSDEETVLKEKERLIEDVINAAVVEQVPESDVISVGFRCSDPFLSQKMSRAICRHAISWHDKMRGQSDENLLFYQHMSDKTRQELSGAEKKLSPF